MSFREELQGQDQQVEEQADPESRSLTGAPGGARQNVRSGTSQGAVARPGGATQNSGGAIENNAEELGTGPARGAD
ncbi:MAG: hypothetical protein JWN79_1829 [Gemmatimonadetes bacterium]|jgi:hypothetical protein|nr:hypothetical protein [Gemmatimonadota bacterium]